MSIPTMNLAKDAKNLTNGKPKPEQTNGTETKVNGTALQIVPGAAIEKTESKPDVKPIEDRIYKVQVLTDLVDRREKLKESLKKLTSFKLSTDGRSDKLTITDSKNEFFTSNTVAIKDVIETLKTSLQKKLDEVEAQIIF